MNDLSMKVVKDYWSPKTLARACTLECFFSLVNYFFPIMRLIISKFFHSKLTPKLEYVLVVRPSHGITNV
jgi:hypothetical protein